MLLSAFIVHTYLFSIPVTVKFTYLSAANTGGADYVDGPYSVVFHAGLTEATLQLDIADDTLYEAGPERLTTVVRVPSQTGDLGVSRREGSHTATVDILDNEGTYIRT